MHRLPCRVLLALLLAALVAGCAHGAPSPSVPVETVPARDADVTTIDGLMRAFYEVVNVAPDGPRQWSRDRTLYSPWIRFVAIGKATAGRPEVEVWTHQQLVDETEPLVRGGFREREIFRSVRRYGNIVHVDSTYETLLGKGADLKRARGVNSLEIYFDGRRFWIASVMWQSEDGEHPIPAALVPAG